MSDGTYLGDAPADPLGDADAVRAQGAKAFARVGSSRPPTLLYRSGPGAIMDLPHFTVLPLGYEAWERIWARRDGIKTVEAPALLELMRQQLGHQVTQLRPFPQQPSLSGSSDEGRDLGVPAIVFPQWFRCTGCNRLARIGFFSYNNQSKHRPDLARFEHTKCRGFNGEGKERKALALQARYLLACSNGHLDEFPYDLWVHRGGTCPKSTVPNLRMEESTAGRGASSVIVCRSCDTRRTMTQAQGEAGQKQLPECRGRHPHLGRFDPAPCSAKPQLMLVGASNLWFPVSQSVIVMPRDEPGQHRALVQALRDWLGEGLDGIPLATLRKIPNGPSLPASDEDLAALVAEALGPDQEVGLPENWTPTDVLRPEWQYLQRPVAGALQEDEASGLTLSRRDRADDLAGGISRVVAVDRLRKANALIGFTRIDERDRVDDLSARLVPLSVADPTWVVTTEDRGEGMLLELDESRVAAWEKRVVHSRVFTAHREAHSRNFDDRTSKSATQHDHLTRFSPPRYWLLHTLSHLLMREFAMSSGYGAASLTERIYAWEGTSDFGPAAGALIMTTASDSDGTLGGLVRLSQPDLLAASVRRALRRAQRCSSDPICASRTPQDPEDFLHGAACHCCTMAAETSCEKANRFLDRRLVVPLPGFEDLAFFSDSL